MLLLLQLAPDLPLVSSLVLSSSSRRRHAVRRTSLGASSSDANDLDNLKRELSKYIEKRRELGGDEAAQAYVVTFVFLLVHLLLFRFCSFSY